MVIILIFGTVAGLLGSYLSADFSAKFAQSNRKKLIRNIEKLTMDQVDDFGIASLVTRITNDNANAQQVLLTFFQMILPSPIMAGISIILAANLSPLLALIPAFSILIFMTTTIVTLNKTLPFIQKIQVKLDKMTLILRESFVGIRIIRAFNKSENQKQKTDKAFQDYSQNNIKINQNFAIFSPVAYCLMNIAMVVIVWLGASLVTSNSLEIGSITALIEFTTTTISTLIMSALVLFQLPKGIASINRINEVLTVESQIQDEEKHIRNHNLSKIDPVNKLTFQDVSFKYQNAEKYVLENIQFEVKSGETLAIVGGTGSGKSSII